MKQVRGIWLPDDDDHFQGHLEQGEEFEGAGTYQWRKITKALVEIGDDRRGLAIDVGAHVGLWTRVLARAFGQVVAYEPVPAMVECFRANTAHLDNVTLHEVAVSNKAGALLIHQVHGNSGNNCVVVPGVNDTERGAVRVDAIALDGASLTDRVDFIKIDVEGWESYVVQGGEQLIRRERPVMVVEQKPGNAERYGLTRTGAVDLLKSWGARVLWEKAGDFCVGWAKD